MSRLLTLILFLTGLWGCELRSTPPAPSSPQASAQVADRATTVRKATTIGLDETEQEAARKAPSLDGGQ